MTAFRFIVDPPAAGPLNMARDEAILTAVGEGDSPPTLRFYRWGEPTISLGYFQTYEEYLALPAPACTLPVVRRQTGGGAILHDLELTYALIVPMDHPFVVDAGPNTIYDRVHDAVAAFLRCQGIAVNRGPDEAGTCSHTGPFFCFDRHSCYDLLVDGRKIMGSAQRRTQRGVLQHGSLILDRRYDQQNCAALGDYGEVDIDAHLPALAEAITGEKLVQLEDTTPNEAALTAQLRTKYAGDDWTQKR